MKLFLFDGAPGIPGIIIRADCLVGAMRLLEASGLRVLCGISECAASSASRWHELPACGPAGVALEWGGLGGWRKPNPTA